MSILPKKITIIFASLLFLLVAFLIWPEYFGVCDKLETYTQGTLCRSPYEIYFGDPAFPFALSFLALSLLSVLATSKTWSRWLKFTIGYAVIVTILLLVMPEIGAGAGGFGLTYVTTEMFAYFYASLYALISVLILIVSDVLERRKR